MLTILYDKDDNTYALLDFETMQGSMMWENSIHELLTNTKTLKQYEKDDHTAFRIDYIHIWQLERLESAETLLKTHPELFI